MVAFIRHTFKTDPENGPKGLAVNAGVGERWPSLLTVEASEAEHADLLGDVVPGPRGAQSLQLGLQLVPHQQDTVGHGPHIVLPAGRRRERWR